MLLPLRKQEELIVGVVVLIRIQESSNGFPDLKHICVVSGVFRASIVLLKLSVCNKQEL